MDGKMSYHRMKLKRFMTLYLDAQKAADYLSLSAETIHKYKEEIGYYRRDRKVIFKTDDLDKWISNFYHKQTNKS